jgi:hypothetical protein
VTASALAHPGVVENYVPGWRWDWVQVRLLVAVVIAFEFRLCRVDGLPSSFAVTVIKPCLSNSLQLSVGKSSPHQNVFSDAPQTEAPSGQQNSNYSYSFWPMNFPPGKKVAAYHVQVIESRLVTYRPMRRAANAILR